MSKCIIFTLIFSVIVLYVAEAQNACPPVDKIVVCYFASWAVYRTGAASMDVTHIDPALCTHVVYTFAGLNIIDNRIVSLDPWNDFATGGGKDSYKRFVQLKAQNPCLKTLLAVGGWNEMSRKYSVMANTAESRREFASSVVRYLTQYEFDGIDFDWEYPSQRGGIPADKQNFISLLQEIKAHIQPWDLILSVAVAVTEDVVSQAYDIKAMADTVDYISLMAYDYTSPTSQTTGLLAPLDSKNANDATIKKSIDLWLNQGCPAGKLVLGIPMYARSYKLQDSKSNGIGAPTVQNDMIGRFTKEIGFLSQYELIELFKQFKYTTVQDEVKQNNYAYNGTYWIAYDDENTIIKKVQYALTKNLGGIMAWSIDTDDFKPILSKQSYPLLRAINKGLGKL